MENRFFVYGIAGLQVIPVFTLTYLQNELSKGSICLLISQSRLFNQAAMFFSFCLLFLQTLPIGPAVGIAISILLVTALSISINYTYHEYTIDEGFYTTIPYFIIYTFVIFVLSTTCHPLRMIQCSSLSPMLISSLVCYILFSTGICLGLELHASALNYVAFLGLFTGTCNVMLIIDENQLGRKSSILAINFLLLQFIHIYLYLTHLLSVQFEIRPRTKEKLPTIFHWARRENDQTKERTVT